MKKKAVVLLLSFAMVIAPLQYTSAAGNEDTSSASNPQTHIIQPSDSEEAEKQTDTQTNRSMSVQAEEEFVIEDGVLIQYNGNSSDVTIPDGVTKIGDEAFYRNDTIETVKISRQRDRNRNRVVLGMQQFKRSSLPKKSENSGVWRFRNL